MNFSLSTHPHEESFDSNHDMDLIALINEARTPEELHRISTMARRRFAARARNQHAAASTSTRRAPRLRSTFSLRTTSR